jgi:small subunit ribosomal protein S6
LAAYARDPRAYELMVIFLPELADDDLTGAIERVSGYITDVTGSIKEILSDSPWGRRRLAYSIRFNGQDYRDGVYIIWHFDLEPSQMGDIERELKLDTRVIRYLVVHDDPKWGSPNEGNQPPAGEADEDSSRGPRRPVAAPARETEAVAVVEEAPASTDDVVVTADEAAATTDEVVATTDDVVSTADDVVDIAESDAIVEELVSEQAAVEEVAAANAESPADADVAQVEAADEAVAEAEEIVADAAVDEATDKEK